MINIFEYAMQMEKDGEDYYRQLVQQTANKGMRTILTMLADEEKRHYFLLENIIDFISRHETWLENAEFYHLEGY